MALLSAPSRAATRDLARLAWPVVMARLGVMTMGLTDAIVVGNYASRELAFHSLAWAPTSVVLTTAVGLMMGVQVMAARMLGEGRPQDVGAVLRRGIAFALQIGFGSALLLILLGPVGLRAAGLEPGLAEGASPALIVFSLSLPFYLLSATAQLFIEALGKPKMSMAAIWVANVVNLGLNLLLVPDLMGLGVNGAVASAWATFGARAALAAFLLIYILRLPEARALGIFTPRPRRRARAAEDRRLRRLQLFHRGHGLRRHDAVRRPPGRERNRRLGGRPQRLGHRLHDPDGSVVRHGRAGRQGLRRRRRPRRAARRPDRGRDGRRRDPADRAPRLAGRRPGGRGLWPRSALLAIAVPALILATLFFVADGIQVVAGGAVGLGGDVWWPTIMHFTAYGAIMMPLGWWLAPRFGVDGLVWAVIVASLVSATLLTGRFVRIARRLA
jgi:multidrug resistance protein, MATE family